MKNLRFRSTDFTFLPSYNQLKTFSENGSPSPRISLLPSQINADEVERKRAKEIVAIFKTTKREMIHG